VGVDYAKKGLTLGGLRSSVGSGVEWIGDVYGRVCGAIFHCLFFLFDQPSHLLFPHRQRACISSSANRPCKQIILSLSVAPYICMRRDCNARDSAYKDQESFSHARRVSGQLAER
jgi:hypothetical protein